MTIYSDVMLSFKSQLIDVAKTTLPICALMLVLDLLLLEPSAGEFALTVGCYLAMVFGFAMFLFGVDIGILPMGSAIGSEIPKRNSVLLAIGIIFTIGLVVTMAEPDVSIFSNMVDRLYPNMDRYLMTLVIALGVAVFVVIATLRIVLKVSMRLIITIGYAIIIILALFAPEQYLGIVFDSGGVTTGPVTIPVLLSISIGICYSASPKGGIDGFGMIGLASIGPLISVIVYGILLGEPEAAISDSADYMTITFYGILSNIPARVSEVALAIIPLYMIFIAMQKFFLHYTWRDLRIMSFGVFHAAFGLVVFLVSIYSAFMPLANSMGKYFMDHDWGIWILLFSVTAGFLVSIAEPSIKILSTQAEKISNGMITRKTITLTVAMGVSLLVGFGIYALSEGVMSIYILLPLYALAIALLWFMDRDLVGLAYDAGGVATGPMSVAILMTMYAAISSALPGSSIGAFGAISLIAIAPILSLSILGIIVRFKKRNIQKKKDTNEGGI